MLSREYILKILKKPNAIVYLEIEPAIFDGCEKLLRKDKNLGK